MSRAGERSADSRLAMGPGAGHGGGMLAKRISDRIPRWASHIAFWDWVIRVLYAAGTLGVAWWATARAYAEGVIQPYGTLGYIAVFAAVIILAFLLGLTFALLTWTMERVRTRRHSQASGAVSNGEVTAPSLTQKRVGQRQPSAHTYKDETVELYKMVTSENPIIDNVVFENCDIVGPVVFIPKRVTFLGKTSFRGSPDIDAFLLDAPPGRSLYGMLELRNCTFIDCAFKNVSVMADPPVRNAIRKMFGKT
jgi:hypothetical protein